MAAEAGSMPRAAHHDSGTHYRRRPFSNWVKKLTNFKIPRNADDSTDADQSNRRSSKNGARTSRLGRRDNEVRTQNHQPSYSLRIDSNPPRPDRTPIPGDGERSGSASDASPTTVGARSVGSAFCDDGARSFAAPSGVTSLADTSRTTGEPGSRRGAGSTFSSPSPSVRSLTTTLTTIQSLAPPTTQSSFLQPQSNQHPASITSATTPPSTQYHQPFPTTPASAIPPHLAPSASTGHPTTYTTATANNLLTDDASILTLASSSKRRRRRSLDTDASVRALAPSSLWGGSRESLPLSVLSANIEAAPGPATPGLHPSGSGGASSSRIMGLGSASAERASVYSPSSTPAALQTDRSSSNLYARAMGDGASVRSGYLGHGRTDSIGGVAGQDLAESHEEA